MRKSLLAGGALFASLTLAHQARAQYPVFDASNFANTLNEVKTAANQLAVLNQQYTQLRQTYEQVSAMQTMFTNPSNILGMFPGLNSTSLQNPMPAAASVAGLVFGATSPTGDAQSFYAMNNAYTAQGADPQAAYLNRVPVGLANILGIAATNLGSIERRLASLTEMQTELQGATDIKQVAAINGRVAIEANAIQGQQAQAANLAAMAQAQMQAGQVSQLQIIRQGHEQAASQFTSTLLP